MNGTVLAILDAVRDSLPVELVADEAYERMAAVAERLPAALTNFYGLECRLGPLGAGVDIAFETRTGSEGQRLLAGHAPSRLDELCSAWPAWRNLRAFANLWADGAHRFHTRFHNVWLEFDTGVAESPQEAETTIGQPSIFLGFAPPERTPAAVLDAMPEALEVLTHGPLLSASVRRFVESLPAGGHIFQTGLMLARPERGLRVCVSQLDAERASV